MSTPQSTSTAPSFVLKMRGDSMVAHGILDGDLVVLRNADRASSGDFVLTRSTGTFKRLGEHDDPNDVRAVAIGLLRHYSARWQ